MLLQYRWVMPGAAALVLVFLMSWAKDSAPWPVYVIAVVAFLGCAAWTLLLHSNTRPPRKN